MGSRSMHQKANQMKEIIKREKRLHKYALMNELKISPSYYEKIKPWFEYTFSDFARYDRSTKEWFCTLEED